MFLCHRCHKAIGPAIPPITIITETRPKTYRNYVEGRDPIESKGWEIVKEIKVCGKCEGILKFLDEADVSIRGITIENALLPGVQRHRLLA